MYIPNFMKPAWHNCINEYVWQTFLCKKNFFQETHFISGNNYNL